MFPCAQSICAHWQIKCTQCQKPPSSYPPVHTTQVGKKANHSCVDEGDLVLTLWLSIVDFGAMIPAGIIAPKNATVSHKVKQDET